MDQTRNGHAKKNMFELLNDLQSARLNDQRTNMPRNTNINSNNYPPPLTPTSTAAQSHPSHHANQQSFHEKTNLNFDRVDLNQGSTWLQDVVRHPPPYPMIALPPNGGYWLEDVNFKRPDLRHWINKDDCDKSAKEYRSHFKGLEHQNYYGLDSNETPIVVSVKLDTNTGCYDLIVRTNDGNQIACVKESPASGDSRLSWLAQQARLDCDCFYPVIAPKANDFILKFDEHSIMDKFKFGVLYQKFGQLTEESIFGNRIHSPAMEEFLEILGQKVELSQHEGYRGGLDTRHGQTGTHALYEVHKGHEIMFHVSTLLPFVETDSQQLQRKCHIGNDIVAIVFQDTNTPFSPDMITSHFLHAYIVIQVIDPCTDKTRYRVSVTAKDDVPHFNPPIPSPAIFRKGDPEFKEFLLDKLINAEMAALRGAAQFKKLELRTRTSLLANLYQDLSALTQQYLGLPEYPTDVSDQPVHKQRAQPSNLIESVKRALSSKSKMESNTNGTINNHTKVSKSKSTLGYDAYQPVKPPSVSPVRTFDSDSGRGSVDMDRRWSTHNQPIPGQLISTSGGTRPNSQFISGQNGTTGTTSESDDSSLNSVEVEEQQQMLAATVNGQPTGNGPFISGSVTTVPIDGASPNNTAQNREAKLREEVSKLKGDKLELLRQNMSAQRELKMLREREVQLQTDLTMASREIQRLHRNARASSSSHQQQP